MRLKVATLIAIISLINPLNVLYHVEDIRQISKYGDNKLDTSFSLLEIFKKKSKRNKKQTSSIEESDSTSDSEIENKNQDSVDKEKKKKRSKFRKRLRRIPIFFRNLFRRNKNKTKANGKHKRNRRHKTEKSASIEEESPDQANKRVRQPETVLKPEVGLGSDSKSGTESGSESKPELEPEPEPVPGSGSEPKAEEGIRSSQGELSIQNKLESMKNLDISKMFSEARNKRNRDKSFVNELKHKLKPQQGGYDQIKNLISEGNPDGQKIILEMNYEGFYKYLNQEMTSNTGGIVPIVELDELISSINFDQMLLNLEPKNGNVEKKIKSLFRTENENYKIKVNSLFDVYRQDYGQECTFEWMNDLVTMYYNAFMEFKSVEEDYQNLLDPRKSTPSERARNLSKTYYSMKEAKSKIREILMKYLNCFMITFFFIKIDAINVGENHEKCTIQDLVTLLYYQNIFLALKNLFNSAFKEKEAEISEFNTMLISGIESLSEEKRNKYVILSRLSEKLFPLYKDANLYGTLIEIIDLKLSSCLTYIINNQESTKEHYSKF
ncbi:hypothetical protein [Cryptosporidium parvum Iowa II]|uniref:Uncharacterized protein n=2 Tax=Cryptosporidium parvum TaxID=5807 RepID=Q5CUR4_CRYPI|nr:hypothetical protein [Cryptosporidium parvum Iowa II]EAK89115.1 conserved hypothetical protein [Cryptosporidium parvum Iowa II]QOY42527.1 Uncharacterized protein CPATCC_0032740 [Cryptosporidium parvum]WKS76920.1 hypothetical protein CPCDC_3g1780 [Cryptosporidium sp. 43IA8]WRK31412.1 Uncharacterized protein cpbgf_3001780 [Cryptosporidium parvum]|eukprot:QOY42527.1 hypothetical protein CPATCC_001174 [Cryptosporidium parvum]